MEASFQTSHIHTHLPFRQLLQLVLGQLLLATLAGSVGGGSRSSFGGFLLGIVQRHGSNLLSIGSF